MKREEKNSGWVEVEGTFGCRSLYIEGCRSSQKRVPVPESHNKDIELANIFV